MPASAVHQPVIAWYRATARSLPWRWPDIDGWSILVSEVMLQQTPVSRVLPVYESWMARWPTALALASDSAGQAVRMWGRLGYPRRALRLWEAAQLIVERHNGMVPETYAELRDLPGIGDYTAAAVAAFAYQRRAVVLDTNVRRVLSRVFGGQAQPVGAVSVAERRLAEQVLPDDGLSAAVWSAAVMELGAVICTVRTPRCGDCPISGVCAWRRLGYPWPDNPRPRAQTYAGTDRQCRGRILALLRNSDVPVPRQVMDAVWAEPQQRRRALRSLLDDGLVVEKSDGTLALPDGAAVNQTAAVSLAAEPPRPGERPEARTSPCRRM